MDDGLVDRAADGEGIALVAEEGGLDPVLGAQVAGHLLQPPGGDAGADLVADGVEDVGGEPVRFPEVLDFPAVLDEHALKLLHVFPPATGSDGRSCGRAP